MLLLPDIEDERLQRLMSERILALTECHMNKDGSLAEGEEQFLFPDGTKYEKANYEFQSLRKLLRHEKAFTPELIGEYLMYQLIQCAISTDMVPCTIKFSLTDYCETINKDWLRLVLLFAPVVSLLVCCFSGRNECVYGNIGRKGARLTMPYTITLSVSDPIGRDMVPCTIKKIPL